MFFFSYLHFFSAVIFCVLAVFVFSRNTRSLLNRVCALTLSCFCIWSFGDAFVENPFVSLTTAVVFENIGSIGWLLFSSFYLWFVVVFVGKKKFFSSRIAIPLLFVVPLVLVERQWSVGLIHDQVKQSFGWIGSWNNTPWTGLFFCYYTVLVIIGFGLLIDFRIKTQDTFKKHQAGVLIVSGVIPFVLGTFQNVGLRQLHLYSVPAIGDVYILAWAIGMVFSISKYGFLGISPIVAAEKIIETMTELMVLLDLKGGIVSVNNATMKILGQNPETLIGSDIGIIFPRQFDTQEFLSRMLRHGSLEISEQNLVSGDGKEIPVSLTATMIPGSGIVIVAYDITLQKKARMSLEKSRNELEAMVKQRTMALNSSNEILKNEIIERKKAEEDLRNSEERFKTLFEYAPDAYYLNDLMGIFINGNKKAEEITGYPREELIGKNFLQLKLISTSYLPRAATLLAKNALGLPTGPDEFVLNRKDGTQVPVEISTHPVKIGTKKTVLGLARDISERKRSEGEKIQLEEQLRQAQKMEAIGQLAGGIAHDFNNMLGAIVGYADTLKVKFGGSNASIDKYVSRILEASKVMTDLTTKLLAFARKGKYEIAVVNIHDTIQDVIKLIEHTFDRRIRIIQQLAASPATVMGDRTQLENAILNLAVNARDAMPDGGDLTFATEVCEISQRDAAAYPYAVSPGPYLELSVTDTGIGMEDSVKVRIFEPFFTTKEKGKGTGLGLASVYGTIKSHNGHVEVETVPGKGTSFHTFFPLVEKPREEKPHPVGVVRMGRGTVMVVDDEDLVRDMAAEMLSDIGYDVISCKDGEEAVREYRSGSGTIDLVLLDLIMPKGGGIVCFGELKKIKPSVRVIIMSGYALDEEAKKIVDAGARGFLQKPFGIAALSQAAEEAIRAPA
jgi:PAS domain S-box-containing protein